MNFKATDTLKEKLAKWKKSTTFEPLIEVKSLEELKSFVKPINILKNKSKEVGKKGTMMVGSTIVKLMKVDGLKEAINNRELPAETIAAQQFTIKKPERQSPRIAKFKVEEITDIQPIRPQMDVADTMIKSGQSSKTIDRPKSTLQYLIDMAPPRNSQQKLTLPFNVISYIKKLERENKELNKMVQNFQIQTNSLAKSLFRLSHTKPSFIEQKKTEENKIVIKFPITSLENLYSIEYGLTNPDFYERAFSQLTKAIGVLVDVKEENILFKVLSTMIDLKIFGLMDYDDNTSKVSLKMFIQFRDLFGFVVNSFNNSKCNKIFVTKEIDNFLKIQIEEQKLILLSQKESDDESLKDCITIDD